VQELLRQEDVSPISLQRAFARAQSRSKAEADWMMNTDITQQERQLCL